MENKHHKILPMSSLGLDNYNVTTKWDNQEINLLDQKSFSQKNLREYICNMQQVDDLDPNLTTFFTS